MYSNSPHWQTHSANQLPFDPLLGCLVILTKHYDSPYSEQALLAGLPLVNNKLTPELFIRAAERANLSSKLVNLPLSDITPSLLPSIALLKNNRACVITEALPDNQFKVIYPETGDGIETVKSEELQNLYEGYMICAKPIHRYDARHVNAPRTATKNWFWKVISEAWPLYSEVLVASLFINIFAIAGPLFVMNVYDRVVPNKALETLWVLAIGVGIAFGFDFLIRTLRNYFLDHAGKNIDIKLSRTIFERLLGIQMGSRPNTVGALANTVYSFESFREFITSATISVLVDAPFVFIFLIVIGLLAGNLVLVPLILIPLILILSLIVQIPLSKYTEQSFKQSSERQAVLIESLACTETIKGMHAEGPMQRRWESVNLEAANTSIKTKFLSNLGANISMFAQQISSIAIVLFGVYKISEGQITTGALVACTMLTSRALAPVSQIARLFSSYQQAKAGLNSVNEMMHMPVERPSDVVFLHRPKLKGSIEFKNVSFSYPNSPIPAIENISFKINAGERVGIIGRTGSGKTTIEKLILKLYLPASGSILVDGTELQQIDPADIRFYIGYVPQNVVLFQGTVKHNITVSAPHVSDESIINAANLSGASSFINIHPEGFEREVGERGDMLSGGQKQCIAIARALLLDPPVLLFDEPSNSMDDSTSTEMIQRLKTILPQKTLVLITHKSSLLNLVDRLIVIDSGKVVADGPKDVVLSELSSGNVKVKTYEA